MGIPILDRSQHPLSRNSQNTCRILRFWGKNLRYGEQKTEWTVQCSTKFTITTTWPHVQLRHLVSRRRSDTTRAPGNFNDCGKSTLMDLKIPQHGTPSGPSSGLSWVICLTNLLKKLYPCGVFRKKLDQYQYPIRASHCYRKR